MFRSHIPRESRYNFSDIFIIFATLILQDSVHDIGPVAAMETSTSTAKTMRARHDNSQSSSISHNQHDEELKRSMASLVSSSSLRKEGRYLSSSSSSVLSDSLASTQSSSRRLSISHQTLSSSVERPKFNNTGATDEESVMLAMTVKLRQINYSEGVDGKQEDEATSIESFEVYFEDENRSKTMELTGYSFLPRSQSILSKVTLNSSQSSTPIESLRSSVFDADGARESEADDNMSAITWPDPVSQRALDATYAMYEQTAVALPMNVENVTDDMQRGDDSNSPLNDGDSVDGDSFLLELDALSLSWLLRKKALEEKRALG